MKKVMPYILTVALLFAAVFVMYFKYMRETEFPVFIESFDHGVVTVENRETVGKDDKFKVICKRGDTITLNINPERTDSKYYNLSKLFVNGINVTDEVDMLQYKTKVDSKLTIIAQFKKGKRPSSNTEKTSVSFPSEPRIENPADNEYLGSSDAYDIKDPSIIYDEQSGWYYCFGSDNAVVRSKDLINWSGRTSYFKSDSESDSAMDLSQFSSVSKWAQIHGYNSKKAKTDSKKPTAPDIVKAGSYYYLYFSLIKESNVNESAIFCVKTKNLETAVKDKKWTDVGVIISSCADAKSNSYDPAFAAHPSVLVNGKKMYMAYGSYFGKDKMNGGIYLLELDYKTGKLKKSSDISKNGDAMSTIHGSDIYQTGKLIANPGKVPALSKKEGSMVTAADIVYNKDTEYFYLFMTYGDEQTNYNIRVARSKSIDGPYLDFNSQSMSEFGKSKKNNQYTKGLKVIGGYNFVMSSGGGVSYTDVGKAAVGAPSIIKSSDGKWFMASQARAYYKVEDEIVTGDKYAADNELKADTAPALEIRQIFFGADDWPLAVPEVYAGESVLKAVKADDMYGNWDVVVFDNSGDPNDTKAIERNVSQMISIFDGMTISKKNIESKTNISKLNFEKKDKTSYSMLLDGKTYTIYPAVAWDWELSEGVLTFTGTSEDGTTIWGKKNTSAYMGIYSDTFWYLLSMTDRETQEKYKEKVEKISGNPSQINIDAMTRELIEIVTKAANK
ncbi:MAG: glycoside hydrolase family 43 protein [Faecalibacterium sp.]|nr:glycoside hydrolase family 43 protein [Ruminococcus sp.]MCM1391851.1 glycoside hydrolase family 43 protein [Ruminococcus sp.]MCM1485715.1 glycoside hydrolase family 43 protein [Faecalibacterium sp.]